MQPSRPRRTLLEVAQQPAGRNPWLPAQVLPRDQQRQLERLGEADPADLFRRHLGDEQVLVLERPAEDCVGVASARSTLLPCSGDGRAADAEILREGVPVARSRGHLTKPEKSRLRSLAGVPGFVRGLAAIAGVLLALSAVVGGIFGGYGGSHNGSGKGIPRELESLRCRG
jgi:hypothetical protein